MIAVIQSIIALTLIGAGDEPVPPVVGDPSLLEFVRDALATNRATLERGRGRFLLEYRYKGLQRRVVIEQEATWQGQRALLSMRYIDPDGLFTGRRSPEAGFAERPYDRVLFDETEVCWYLPESGLVRVRNIEPGAFSRAIYNLLPAERWHRWSVPDAEGPLIEDVIQPQARRRQLVDHYEVFRRGTEIVWRRHDRDEGALELVFSAGDSTVPTSFTYTNPSPRIPGRRGFMKWVGSGQRPRLDEFEITQALPGRPTEADYTYKLKVMDYSEAGYEAGTLSRTRFLNSLPPNTLVEDDVRKKEYRINTASTSGRRKPEGWDRLIDRVRSRGFLAK